MTKIIDIEGIGEAYAKKLEAAGIGTLEILLSQGCEPGGRGEIAEKTGISPKLILKWINRADLDRIAGIGSEYADLLEIAGVDTVPELATRKPENLHQKLSEINEQKKLVRRLPSLSQVEAWIESAKNLPRVIKY